MEPATVPYSIERRQKEAKGMHRREIGESLPYPAGGQADRWGSAGYNHGRSTGEFSMDAPPLMEDDVLHQHLPTPAEEEEQSNEGTFFGVLETNVTASIGETAFLRCRLQKTQHQVSSVFLCPPSIQVDFGLLDSTSDPLEHVLSLEMPSQTIF